MIGCALALVKQIGCDLALVKQHMEYQRLQEFHQSRPCATGMEPMRVQFSSCLAPSGVHNASQCGIAAVAVSPHIGRSIRVVGVSSLTPTFSVS